VLNEKKNLLSISLNTKPFGHFLSLLYRHVFHSPRVTKNKLTEISEFKELAIFVDVTAASAEILVDQDVTSLRLTAGNEILGQTCLPYLHNSECGTIRSSEFSLNTRRHNPKLLFVLGEKPFW
jgi:hypothetical protein